jgi:cold shock CspA family protein/ribosome-associated translation inhibitor RaiA
VLYYIDARDEIHEEANKMILPLQITFHDVDKSEALEAKIREDAAKLDQFHESIMSCRVVIEAPHRRHHTGTLYHLRIDVSVPGKELVVDREPGDRNAHEDPYVMVRDAFLAMERKLKDYDRRRHGETKLNVAAPHAHVSKMFLEQGYGFIETIDGREIYFNANSVLNDGFRRLKVGMEVRFKEEMGEKGPQASTVDPVGKEAGHKEGTHSLGKRA